MTQPAISSTTTDFPMRSAKALTSVNMSQRAFNTLLSTCLSHNGLTSPQWVLIGAIAEEPSTPTTVAKKLGIKLPYVAILLKQLKDERGIIDAISDADDARSKKLHLSPEGTRIVADIEDKLQVCMRRELAEKLSAEDIETYFRVSEFIAQNVRHHD